MKLWLFCKEFDIDMGTPAFVDSDAASIECLKDHWKMRMQDGADEYRKYVVQAEICSDYEQVDD